MSRRMHALLGALATAVGCALPAAAVAANACSSMVGRVTLNEYNYIDNFTEVKKLDGTVNMTGWKVTIHTAKGAASGLLPTGGANSCDGGAYQVNGFNANDISQNADVVLLDANNDVVDVLRVRTANTPFTTTYYPSTVPACTYVSPPYNLVVSSANKGVDRSPDGVGQWRNTPGTGSGSFATRCAGNTPGGAPTDLRVTKTAGAGGILVGANVTFTVDVSNLGPNIGSALVVTDQLPAGLAYVSHTTTAGTYSAATGLWSLPSLAVGSTQTLTVTASGASVGTWVNTAAVASDNNDTNSANNTASATVAVGASTPGSFNAFDTATPAAAITGVIRTKVAGAPFALDVVAIRNGAQAGTFSDTVRVELLGHSATGGALDASLCPVGATLLQTTSAALANGRGTANFSAVGNAWKDVRVRVSFPAASPTVVSCSTDNFAIRPSAFDGVTVSDADSASAGTARPLYNTSASGGNVHRAGRPFRIAATAVGAGGVATSNYAGSPEASVSACVLPASGCTPGGVAIGSWTAAAGSVETLSASYSEVGAFSMKLVDSHFADVDLADSSAAERHVESAVFSVGRFVPDHFDLSPVSAPQFKTFNDTSCATRSFTYVGQPFGYLVLPQATITAKDATGGITRNYAGGLWKLTAAAATQTYAATTGLLDTGLIGTPALVETGSGNGTLTANADDVVAFLRSTPVAPFSAAISLSMSVRDASESSVAGNGTVDTATPALFADIAFDSGKEIRFGRLQLTNAHGSELLALPVPVETQYWNGSAFQRNAADACTRLAANQVVLSGWRRDLAACETSVTLGGRFQAGRGNLRLSAPGAGNTGSVDLSVDLGATGGGSSCIGGAGVAAGGASQTWLQGRGSGAAYDQNPAARASFGLYRGSKALIYLREIY